MKKKNKVIGSRKIVKQEKHGEKRKSVKQNDQSKKTCIDELRDEKVMVCLRIRKVVLDKLRAKADRISGGNFTRFAVYAMENLSV